MIENFKLYEKSIMKAVENNNFFQKLKNKSIIITGCNGLIASCVVDILNYLNEYNYNIKIIGLVRNKKHLLQRFNKYRNLEIIEQDVIQDIKYKNDVDYIIHAASNSHPMAFSEDPVGTMNSNFIGMNNILQYAISHNTKRVEYVSSGEVYGQGDEKIESFKEDYNGKIISTNPRSCYPLSKLASETLCVSYSQQYGIETVIARPCHCYGPTQTEKDSRALSQFINNVLNNEDIIMKSNGSQIRSLCYVIDCAIALLTLLIKGENCNAYNIANKNSILSIKDMAEIIAKKANKKVIFHIPTDIEKRGYNTVSKLILNTKKIEELGWRPCWNFEDGIDNTLKIMRNIS